MRYPVLVRSYTPCSDETRFQGIATREGIHSGWRRATTTCSDETRFQGIATCLDWLDTSPEGKKTCSDETRFQGIATGQTSLIVHLLH